MTTAPAATSYLPTIPPRRRSRWIALALLAVAQLMLILDVTVVNVALPAIGRGLHLHQDQLPWVMTIYTLFFGGLMLLGGRVADLFGPRRLTLIGLALFITSSLLCGLAGGASTLLAGRASQGISAALMSPAALATVMTMFTEDERGRALGVWSGLAGIGSALGVIVGGVLTTEAGWRWVFAINVPIGIALLIAIPFVAPAGGARGSADRRLDLPGATLVTAGTAAAIYGLTEAGSHGWSAAATLVPLALAALAWAGFALLERHVARPLITVALLTRRPVLAGSFLMVVATGLMIGGFFLGSFSLQNIRHYSALHVGVSFLPIAVGVAAGAHLGSRLLARFNARNVSVGGFTLAAAGYATAAWSTEPVPLVAGLSLAALGIGAVFVTAFTTALAGTTPNEGGLRSALVNTFHELGGAIGVAVLSSVAGASLIATHPSSSGFAHAFTVGAACAAVGLVIAGVLVPPVHRDRQSGRPAH